MNTLPPIVITQINPHPIDVAVATERSIWADFLSLKTSKQTQRVYAAAIADFCDRVYQQNASPSTIRPVRKFTASSR